MKAWIMKDDIGKAIKEGKRDSSQATFVYIGDPGKLYKRELWVEIELPEPPPPFEAEVWVYNGDHGCQCLVGQTRCSLPPDSCRKITLREVSK